jgi:hypothetical protein
MMLHSTIMKSPTEEDSARYRDSSHIKKESRPRMREFDPQNLCPDIQNIDHQGIGNTPDYIYHSAFKKQQFILVFVP